MADVVTLFSKPSARLRQRQLSSSADAQEKRSEVSSEDDDGGVEEVDSDEGRAPPAAEEAASNEGNSNGSDPSQLTLEQVHARLAELENAASPTQSEINAILAQYLDSSSDGAGGEGAGADSESESDEEDSDDEETVIMKVLVVGNARCGKTSTIRRFVREDFSDEYVSTIGADFVEKMVAYDDKLTISLQLWDIAGQDRFAKFTRAYFRDARGAVIVCDITRENTVDAVESWKSEIDACCRDFNGAGGDDRGDDFPVVMVANKSDLLLDPMSALNLGVSMQKCVSRNGIVEWFRASAKNGESVSEAFGCLINCMVANHRAQKQRQQEAAEKANNYARAASDESESEGEDDSSDSIIRLGSALPPASLRSREAGYGCECH